MRSVMSAVLALLCMGGSISAAYPPLKVMQASDQAVTVGSEAFSVEVGSTGRVQKLQAGGVEYVSFIALYTGPTSFETGKSIRAVQGEGPGRDLGPAPSSITAERRGERYFIPIRHVAAREEICGGDPLYELLQTVEIAPSGALNLRYEVTYLRFFQMGRPIIYVALAAKTFAGLTYWADYSGRCEHGVFTEDKEHTKFEGLDGPLRSMQVDCPAGPFTMWLDTDTRVTSTRWGDAYDSIGLAVVGGQVYAGVRDVVQYTIKVPL